MNEPPPPTNDPPPPGPANADPAAVLALDRSTPGACGVSAPVPFVQPGPPHMNEPNMELEVVRGGGRFAASRVRLWYPCKSSHSRCWMTMMMRFAYLLGRPRR